MKQKQLGHLKTYTFNRQLSIETTLFFIWSQTARMSAELWLCAFWVRLVTAQHQDQNKHVRESVRALPAAGVAIRGAAPGAGPVDRTGVRRRTWRTHR